MEKKLRATKTNLHATVWLRCLKIQCITSNMMPFRIGACDSVVIRLLLSFMIILMIMRRRLNLKFAMLHRMKIHKRQQIFSVASFNNRFTFCLHWVVQAWFRPYLYYLKKTYAYFGSWILIFFFTQNYIKAANATDEVMKWLLCSEQ